MTGATLTAEYVTDTIGLVLYLEKRQLKSDTRQIFQKAEIEEATIFIPAMVLAEILYLSQKGRIQTSLSTVSRLLQKHPNFKEYPMTFDVIRAAEKITDIPELHDRLIAATANLLGIALITNDLKIEASAFVNTIW